MENNNIVIDEDFAAIHGYLCADGYVSRNPPSQKHIYYRIGLRNTEIVLLKDFQSKFEAVFGKRPIISKQLDRCNIGNKKIFLWLRNRFGSFHSHDWTIPETLMTYSMLASWLKAFFDCEAWVASIKGKDRKTAVESINLNGLNKIKWCLKKYFKINSVIYPRVERKTSVLCICDKKSLIRFRDKIGFNHHAKRQKLEEAINSFIDYNWKLPEPERELRLFVLNFLKKRIKNSKHDRIRIYSSKKKNLLKLSKALKKLFAIKSRVSKARFNGVGTRFFELELKGRENVNRLIELLNP